MNLKEKLSAVALALGCAGCFTIGETPFAGAEMPAPDPAAAVRTVVLRGFEATVRESVAVQGYETRYVSGYHGRRHYHPGYYETVPVTTWVSQEVPTDYFLALATDRMEESGFNLQADPADYIVEVKFRGPLEGADDAGAWRAVRLFCSLFTCDKDRAEYVAKLKIYDNRTGRLVFNREYGQEYEVSMFSPIPLFGPLFYPRTADGYMKSWCLTALTERVTSEAAAFLKAEAK